MHTKICSPERFLQCLALARPPGGDNCQTEPGLSQKTNVVQERAMVAPPQVVLIEKRSANNGHKRVPLLRPIRKPLDQKDSHYIFLGIDPSLGTEGSSMRECSNRGE